MEQGKVRLYHVQHGDVTLSFDNENDADIEKAVEIIDALAHEGFVFNVEKPDGTWVRAKHFDSRYKVWKIEGGEDVPLAESEAHASAPPAKGSIPAFAG